MSLEKDIKEIKKNISTFKIDDIKIILRPYLKDLISYVPIIPQNSFFYRIRKLNNPICQKIGMKTTEVAYPPNPKIGRANRENRPVFYCSSSKNAPFFETKNLKQGDEVIVSFWQNTKPIILNHIGYTQQYFESMGASRPIPQFAEINNSLVFKQNFSDLSEYNDQIKKLKNNDVGHITKEIFSNNFTNKINNKNKELYKLTASIAELFIGNGDMINGITYPSTAMAANGDNIAINTSFFDKHIIFKKASHLLIEKMKFNTFSTKELDYAISINNCNELEWKGHKLQWSLTKKGQIGNIALVGGLDEYGDYSIDKNGKIVHWEFTDEDGKNILPN